MNRRVPLDPERLASLRTEYAEGGLDEADAGDDPLALFSQWFDEVADAGVPEPNAMALATATPDAVPSVRTVLLKGIDERGLTFYTHYTSRKGAELEANPRAAVTMLWHPLQRQVRVEGRVEHVDADESDAYFASRPRGAQVGAVASEQSRVVPDRDALQAAVDAVEAETGDADVARPPTWGGYRIVPTSFEFWQGRPDRVHDRLLFTRTGDEWVRVRLQP